MTTTRKQHSPKFKARVAVEAIRGPLANILSKCPVAQAGQFSCLPESDC
jgi:hypothetical protein